MPNMKRIITLCHVGIAFIIHEKRFRETRGAGRNYMRNPAYVRDAIP